MRNNTEEVKKNFLKKIKMILSIIMLSLIMVPCITSCIHGNNPNKPADKVEEEGGDPPKVPTDPVPGMTSDQMIEELVSRKLGKINQDTYFYTFDIDSESFRDDLDKHMNPFNLGRKKGDNSGRLYLISDTFDKRIPGGLYLNTEALKKKQKETFREDLLLEEGIMPEDKGLDYNFKSLSDVLEWKWKIAKFESEGSYFFYKQCYPWLSFGSMPQSYPGSRKPKNMYRICDPSTDYIAVDTNNGKPEIYFINITGLNHFEWWITFINKNDKSQIYSFHVGPYSIMKGSSDDDKVPCPPEDDAEYPGKTSIMEKNYAKRVFHMLKLSTIVRLSLGKDPDKLLDDLEQNAIEGKLLEKLQYEAYKAIPSKTLSDEDAKVLAKKRLKDHVKINPFVSFSNLGDWDVYLTFGEFCLDFSSTATQTPYMWHNTVKLTGTDADEFWGKCWN